MNATRFQLDLPFRKHGGARRGAGRKRSSAKGGVAHHSRPLFKKTPVHLTWRVATEAGGNLLHLDWREENGPPVTSSPTRSGFGTRLIQYSATQSLAAQRN